MSPLSASQPLRMLFLANLPRGIFLASQPIYFIWLFIIFMSKISLTRSCTLLSKLDCTYGCSSFSFPVLADYFTSSFFSSSQFIYTYLYPPPSLSLSFLLNQRIATSGEQQGILACCPYTPTLPQRVKNMKLFGLVQFWRICRMQNLLLLFWRFDWLRVLAKIIPPWEKTLQFVWLGKYWSIGMFPLRITFFKSYFAGYLADYLAGYLAGRGLSSPSSFFLEAERSLLLVFFGSLLAFLSSSSTFTFLAGSTSLLADLSSCLPLVLVLGSSSLGLSSFSYGLGALLRVDAFGGIIPLV